MGRIVVAYQPDSITLAHSLLPLVRGKYRHEFVFARSIKEALRYTHASAILLVRFHKLNRGGFDPIADLLGTLHERFLRVGFFDDSANSAALAAPFLNDANVIYYKKQVLSERSEYCETKDTATVYRFGSVACADPDAIRRNTRSSVSVERIRLSWNLGIGSLPRDKRTKAAIVRLEQLLGPKALRFLYRTSWRRYSGRPNGDFISARWQSEFGNDTVRMHRQRFFERVQAHAAFRTGRIHQREYNRELKDAFATLSPFGFGEVCYRDFEAAIFRSCLIKPDMSHVETWPDIYLPHQSYVPVKWDASDVIETAEELLRDRPRARRIAENAFDILSDAYNHLDERVEMIVKDLLG